MVQSFLFFATLEQVSDADQAYSGRVKVNTVLSLSLLVTSIMMPWRRGISHTITREAAAEGMLCQLPFKLVARAPDGGDVEEIVLIGVKLLPQPLDVRINRAVVAYVLIAPDESEQVVAGEDAIRRGGEGIEELGFPPREIKLFPADGHAQRGHVDDEGADDQRIAGGLLFHAAHDAADAGHDLAWKKGLDDVIVRAGIQTENPVCFFAACADHQDGDGGDGADTP